MLVLFSFRFLMWNYLWLGLLICLLNKLVTLSLLHKNKYFVSLKPFKKKHGLKFWIGRNGDLLTWLDMTLVHTARWPVHGQWYYTNQANCLAKQFVYFTVHIGQAFQAVWPQGIGSVSDHCAFQVTVLQNHSVCVCVHKPPYTSESLFSTVHWLSFSLPKIINLLSSKKKTTCGNCVVALGWFPHA